MWLCDGWTVNVAVLRSRLKLTTTSPLVSPSTARDSSTRVRSSLQAVETLSVHTPVLIPLPAPLTSLISPPPAPAGSNDDTLYKLDPSGHSVWNFTTQGVRLV